MEKYLGCVLLLSISDVFRLVCPHITAVIIFSPVPKYELCMASGNDPTRCERRAYSSCQRGCDIHLSLFHANYSEHRYSPKITRVTQTRTIFMMDLLRSAAALVGLS